MYSNRCSSSVSSTGALRQISSGYSRNDPTALTTTALPIPQPLEQSAGAFADGRITQVQDDVARGDIAVEVLDRRELMCRAWLKGSWR